MSDFKFKIKGSRHKKYKPFFCPNCKKISGSIDDRFFLSYGICAECFVNFVEDREVPKVELTKFIPECSELYGLTESELLSKNLCDPKGSDFLSQKK